MSVSLAQHAANSICMALIHNFFTGNISFYKFPGVSTAIYAILILWSISRLTFPHAFMATSVPGGLLPLSTSRETTVTGTTRNQAWCRRKKAHLKLHTTTQLMLWLWKYDDVLFVQFSLSNYIELLIDRRSIDRSIPD